MITHNNKKVIQKYARTKQVHKNSSDSTSSSYPQATFGGVKKHQHRLTGYKDRQNMDSSPPFVNVYPDLEETDMTTDQLKVSFDNTIQMMQDKLLSKKASNANSGDNSDDDEGSDNDFTKEQYVSNSTMQLSDLDQT